MAPERKRDNSGQYQREFSDDDIVAAVKQHEPASTAEVARAVGYAQRSSAEYRLKKLREEGRVRSKKVGRELVWMLGEGES